MSISLFAALVAIPAQGAATEGAREPVEKFQSSAQLGAPTLVTGVVPGLTRTSYRASTSGGAVDLQVLSFSLEDPRVDLTPRLGRGTVAGLETPAAATAGTPGGIAAINAGFFDYGGDPLGDPHGLHVIEGNYLSNPQKSFSSTPLWRGGFGITNDDEVITGRPGFSGTVTLPAHGSRTQTINLTVDGINRRPARATTPAPEPSPTNDEPDDIALSFLKGDPASGISLSQRPDPAGETVLLTDDFGSRTGTPGGTVEITVDAGSVDESGTVFDATVSISEAGDSAIPAAGFVIAATGNDARTVLDAGVGGGVRVATSIADGWENLRHAVAAGPLMIRNGQPTADADHEREGFNPRTHVDARHPRTAIGFTADGTVLMVTADGRSSRSAGISTRNLTNLLLELGATDAVMLDGGGSTGMFVDGQYANRPSDSGGARSVASNLVVTSTWQPQHLERFTGRPSEVGAALALRHWPDGADDVVIVNAEAIPDGLTAGPLAIALDAPLLTVSPDSVPSRTRDALVDLDTRTVHLVGGEEVIEPQVADAIADLGIEVRRHAGPERFSTAAAVAQALDVDRDRVFLASARSFPDAIAASVAASVEDVPILLTEPTELISLTRDQLTNFGVSRITIIGGPEAVSTGVEQQLQQLGYRTDRIAGGDRYDTASKLADVAVAGGTIKRDRVFVTSGTRFIQPLIAGPAAAKSKAVVLLSDQINPNRSPAIEPWLAGSLTRGVVIGGTESLSTWVGVRVDDALVRGQQNS